MKLETIRKTALIKREGRSVMLLKLNIPKDSEDSDFALRFNSFYTNLAKKYIECAKVYAEKEGEQLLRLSRPLNLTLVWEICAEEKTAPFKSSRKIKKATCAFSQRERIIIKRTSLFEAESNNRKRAEYIDVFDAKTGFLLG